jgi:hypothetical protein
MRIAKSAATAYGIFHTPLAEGTPSFTRAREQASVPIVAAIVAVTVAATSSSRFHSPASSSQSHHRATHIASHTTTCFTAPGIPGAVTLATLEGLALLPLLDSRLAELELDGARLPTYQASAAETTKLVCAGEICLR